MKDLPGSILASVLVVSTLLLLTLLLGMAWMDAGNAFYYRYHHRKQQEIHLESAFMLYSRDSTLGVSLTEDSLLLLYPEQPDSRVRLQTYPWGLYEVVKAESPDGKYASLRLFGKAAESWNGAVLYVPDNGRSLSLAGKTAVSGKVFFPGNGILYNQIRSERFTGKPVEVGALIQAQPDFPARDTAWHCFWGKYRMEETGGRTIRQQSFGEETLGIKIGTELRQAVYIGNIILQQDSCICVHADNHLENIILAAPVVKIRKGFRGTVQVFATDSVLLEEGVRLENGSGLFLKTSAGNGSIRLGGNCRIDGYVIVSGDNRPKDEKKWQYIQQTSDYVRGLVYIDGRARVQGRINGSLYGRELDWQAPEASYSMVLYQLTLLADRSVGYPLWMTGPYRRRCIKWLD